MVLGNVSSKEKTVTKPLYHQIREKYQLGPAYHMTHIQNLRAILTSGELLSYNQMRGKTYLNLANEDVQSGRAAITIDVTQKPLHDYVPLYFGFKTPMVAFNQVHNENLLFLRFSLNILSLAGVTIADGNARAKGTRFKIYQTIDDLSFLDVSAICTVKYAKDIEIKRKKQAELLVPDHLSITHLLDIICFSDNTRSQVLAMAQQFGIKTQVRVNTGWYFTPKK